MTMTVYILDYIILFDIFDCANVVQRLTSTIVSFRILIHTAFLGDNETILFISKQYR